MAIGQAEIGRRQGLASRLIVPRPITHICLWVIGIGLGIACWHLLSAKLLGVVSSLAGGLCLIIATSIWNMREKADAALDGEHFDSASFLRARHVADSARRRSMARTALVIVAALLAFFPLVSVTVVREVWDWMIISCGIGIAEAIYSFLLANAWEEEYRLLKDKKILLAKERAELDKLIERIESSAPAIAPSSTWKIPGEPHTLTK